MATHIAVPLHPWTQFPWITSPSSLPCLLLDMYTYTVGYQNTSILSIVQYAGFVKTGLENKNVRFALYV